MSPERVDIVNKVYEDFASGSERLKNVIEIFNEYFGEDRVDFSLISTLEEFTNCAQNRDFILDTEEWKTLIVGLMSWRYSILVYFPEVTITNESNKSAVLKDLYVKIIVNSDGRLFSGYIYMTRASYSRAELDSDYMHSHCPGIPRYITDEGCFEFLKMCLGSGPINGTINTLYTTYDEDKWTLFCWELDKVVRTESLVGIPYRKLENIGFDEGSALRVYVNYSINYDQKLHLKAEIIEDFVKYIIDSKQLKFVYSFNVYELGMSYRDYIVTISNLFISWYNSLPETTKAEINTSLIISGCLYKVTEFFIYENFRKYSGNIDTLQTTKVCTFKGRDIYVKITDNTTVNTPYTCTLMLKSVADTILTCLLNTINYGYKNSKANLSPTSVRII